MGKRSTGKKRGTQEGLAKHKIESNSVLLQHHGKKQSIFGIGESVYYSAAKFCFNFWFLCCCKLYLTPFTRTTDGTHGPLSGSTAICIHYCAWLIGFTVLLQKFAELAVILLTEELKIQTFMCLTHSLIYFASFCISLVIVAKRKQKLDLLNSIPLVLSSMEQIGAQSNLSQFEELATALKIIAVFLATQGTALMAALLSLAFSTLPTCYFPAVESLGLIPTGLLPPFGWQLIFFPMEYATYRPPRFTASLAGSIILITFGVLRVVGKEIRLIQHKNSLDLLLLKI